MTTKDAPANAYSVFKLRPAKSCKDAHAKKIVPYTEVATWANEFTPAVQHVSSVKIHTELVDVDLGFTETFPIDPARPEVITNIDYRPQKIVTDAEVDEFTKMAVQKYGAPPAGGSYCLRGHPLITHDRPLDGGPFLVAGWNCLGRQPVLSIAGYGEPAQYGLLGLTLYDGHVLRDRERKLWESQQKGSLPPL
jgi:hypothetical protein